MTHPSENSERIISEPKPDPTAPAGLAPAPADQQRATVEDEGPFKPLKFPWPKPIEPAYTFNRWIALATSPRRLWNYLKYRRRTKQLVANYLPVQLDIEPVSRCNFHCRMCQVSDWPKHQRAADMSFEDFKTLIDSQYGLLEVKIQGYGEPLLARDAFFEMIAYARKKHIWVRTTTNASLLHFNDNYKKLIDSGVNEVQISIDGASKESFERIRRGSKFELVVENCKLINTYCKSKNLLRTRMWTTLQADTVGEFFEFLPLAREMGFERLTYSLNLHGFGQEKWIEGNDKISATEAVRDDMCAEAIAHGKEMGINVTFFKATGKYSTRNTASLCCWPFERVFISSDLRVAPCCVISNPQTADLGDARSFAQDWNGPALQEFRRAHLEGRIPAYCRECYSHTSHE